MSETKKKNPAIACGNMKKTENELIIEYPDFGHSKNDIINLAGMEIKVEGYEIVFDENTGRVLRIKDNRTISEIIDDRNKDKIIRAMKTNKKEGIEL